ncbi:MAG TPA: putative toxin-antitoxin system toxin component, PIN family, partial [Thermoanaerobaculia bacterium]|jgi:putative PIN family toxin of toxin-antitoxin system|nr:putative toxin-antitoxin system toxin component, PIN family [Thermoanaerobaculia bacterium]
LSALPKELRTMAFMLGGHTWCLPLYVRPILFPLASVPILQEIGTRGKACEGNRRRIRTRLESRSPIRLCLDGLARLDPAIGIAYNTTVKKRRVVLDTNVVVAALRSRQGASFKLLSLLGEDRFEIALSVPLLFEYEDALARHIMAGLYGQQDIDDFLDHVCQAAHRQSIFFLWRPCLPDPKDDMVLELAVAAGCEAIVTHDQRDFVGAERFGARVAAPRDFLRILEELT